VLSTPTTGYWAQRHVCAMGSQAHLVVGDADDAVIEWGVAELERLEQAWSRFRSDSDLARLHDRPGEWVMVGHALLLALTCAADLHHATGGAFDPTIRRALEHAGYDRTFTAVEVESDDDVVRCAVPGFAHVEIDVARSAVRIARGIGVDLGGIGKGLAADLVARGLVDRGARTALVGVGGDLRTCGEPPPDGWLIPVVGPFDEARPAFHYRLTRGAIVQSTTTIRRWSRGGRILHHIIDPATGAPCDTGVVAAVVAAPEAWWAEGIAKAVMIAGIDRARAIVERADARVWAFLDDGRVDELGGFD
jgi:thiamine biosynthesis lipoprotein